MKNNKKELKVQKEPERQEMTVTSVNSPADIIRIGVTSGANLEQLEKLLLLKERCDVMEAKKAYTQALSEFKKEVPTLLKDKKNKQYDSKYVSKGNLINTITPILSKFGFSASFLYPDAPEGLIKVVCRLTHAKGHNEETSFSAPIDVSGAKNPIQQRKSTLTYLEKITFAGILGVESREEIDDDGNSSQTPIKQSKPIRQAEPVKKEQPRPIKEATPPPTATKEQPKKAPSPFADMLAKFAKAKDVLGKDEYFKILGANGYEHGNQIPHVAEGNKILEVMRKRAIALKEDK